MSALSWQRDGQDWPNRAASRFVTAAGLRWHVQIMGQGPVLLLLHGTGAATHSWRGLAPLLAERFTIVAPDLPGHGFTEAPEPERLSLPAMARAVAALLGQLAMSPEIIVGHSAGAAIALRLVLDRAVRPRAIVSLNGALLPFRGVASQLFPSLARLLVLNPLVPRFFAWRAGSAGAVENLLEGTGSQIDAAGLRFYQRLFASRVHVASTLAMMAHWDLHGLGRDFSKLDLPILLIAGSADRAVRPAEAAALAERLPQARLHRVAGGHLVHEEDPALIAGLICAFMEERNDLRPSN